MLYKAQGSRKRTRKLEEGPARTDREMAIQDALDMIRSHAYKTVVILQDSEGADHPDNAGKFFLEQILK